MTRIDVTKDPGAALVASRGSAKSAPSSNALVNVGSSFRAAEDRYLCAQLEADIRFLEREDRAYARREREDRRRTRERAEVASIRHGARVQAAKADVARRERERQERKEDARAERAALLDERTRARSEEVRAHAFASEEAERVREELRAAWSDADAERKEASRERARARRIERKNERLAAAQTADSDADARVLKTRAKELARIDHQIVVQQRRSVLASLRDMPTVDHAADELRAECERIALDVSTGTVRVDENNLYHGFAGLKFREAAATLAPADAITATVETLVWRRKGQRELTLAEAQAFADRYHALTRQEAERESFEDARALLLEFGIATEDDYGKDETE